MLIIKPLTVADFFSRPEAQALVACYAAECGNVDFTGAPPDVGRYTLLMDKGMLFAFGAFDGDVLVGFVAVTVTGVPHYDGKLLASVDSVYVRPDRRAKGAGLRLLKAAKAEAIARGAPGLYLSAPAGSRFERLLRLVARHTNTVFYWS